MNYSIENIDLSALPLSYPNSLIMLCRDFPEKAVPGEPLPILITLTSPVNTWDFRYDLIAVQPTYNGEPVPFEPVTTPAGIRADTGHGTFEICFEDNLCLRIRSTGGLGVRFFMKFNRFEQFYDRLDGSVEAVFRPMTGEFLFEAVSGRQTYRTEYLPDECRSSDTYVYWEPRDGVAEGYIAHREHNVKRRTLTRTIEQCFKDNKANFEKFYADTYKLPDEKIRGPFEVSVYMIWSHLITDYGAIKGAAVYMGKSGVMRYAKGWHQAMQGAAAWRNLELALELIYQIPATADEYGMASGGISNIGAHYRNPMAPIHGWALAYVVKRHGGWDCLSEEWARKLYDILVFNTQWWREFSDVDGNGIIGYTHSDSSGWNDATMFLAGVPATTPDISAWLVVQTEVCGHLARRLGKNAEADYWFEFSDRMLKDMIDYLWDGEKFVVKHDITGEIPPSHSIGLFQVVMLGKRLPQHITDKLVAALADKSRFNAPQGFTLEAMDSPYYDVRGKAMCLGRIFGMANFYAIYGLYQSGEIDFALERARNWAEEAVEYGPQTIMPSPPQTWEPMKIEGKVFDCLPTVYPPAGLSSWGCGTYLNIANMLDDDFCA
ncbi:MAG: hypothetical protein GXX89_04365 [Clostridiales bacterium]|nr:hypothetical protein [Clostridiales bacterium]